MPVTFGGQCRFAVKQRIGLEERVRKYGLARPGVKQKSGLLRTG